MKLIKQFYDENAQTKYDKKRAIVSCENCGEEKDVRYSYYLDCVKKDRKFCKSCKAKHDTEEMKKLLNSSEPLSICIDLVYKKDKKPIGLFQCTSCGKTREREHKKKPYFQYCSKCTLKGLHDGNKKHPIVDYQHRLHRIINNMIQRTTNVRNKRYDDYGGRGIKVCKEWSTDRTKFYDWALSNGYSKDLSIDRINNDKGYYPENCKWSTNEEQQINQRIQKDNTTGYRGVGKTKNGFRARIGDVYIDTFKTAEEANAALIGYRLAKQSAK